MARARLVIDVQNDYFPGGALPLWRPEETEARIVSAIGRARAAGDRIILVRHESVAPAKLFVAGSAGASIRSDILTAAGDVPTITKHYADAFQDTDLADHLAGVDELLICGMMTQNCVVFTAMSRTADHFRVRVLGNLCTAPTEVVHRIALNALASKIEVEVVEDI